MVICFLFVGLVADVSVGSLTTYLFVYVFHDWDSGRGNVDHFIIGPKGMFAVETKARKGEVTCDREKLLLNGRPIPGKDNKYVSSNYAKASLILGA